MNKKLLFGLLIATVTLFTFTACEKDNNDPQDPTDVVPTDTVPTTPTDTLPTTPEEGFICKEWTNVDLTALGSSTSILISFDSSDKGAYGINTPTYVCLDNLAIGDDVITFESGLDGGTIGANGYWDGSDGSCGFEYPALGAAFWNLYNTEYKYSEGGFSLSTLTDQTTAGMTNQYSVYATSGAEGSSTFAVVYYSEYTASTGNNWALISITNPTPIKSVMVNNSTYAYLSMTNGDAYAKKFAEGDWFKVIFTGLNDSDEEVGKVEFYLADFRK